MRSKLHTDTGLTGTRSEGLCDGGGIEQTDKSVPARSDWMKVERERGISVTTSVMTFDYSDCTFNLLGPQVDRSCDVRRARIGVGAATCLP